MIVNGNHVQSVNYNGNSVSKLIRNGVELYRKIEPVARYSCKGLSNSDTDRDILKDLTNNGHDIQLKNFAWSGMSGYGGFNENFKNWSKFPTGDTVEDLTDSKFVIKKVLSASSVIGIYKSIVEGQIVKLDLNITGIPTGLKLYYGYTSLGDYVTLVNGINHVELIATKNFNSAFRIDTIGDYNITIEQLPLYPDGLVFDGIIDYGINDNFTVGDDYTVICKRKWFDLDNQAGFNGSRVFISKRDAAPLVGGEFNVEKLQFISDASTINYAYSYGGRINISLNNNKEIVVQTKNFYENEKLTVGSATPTNYLLLGASIVNNTNNIVEKFKGVIYDLIIYNKSLTPEEIQSEIKKYNL